MLNFSLQHQHPVLDNLWTWQCNWAKASPHWQKKKGTKNCLGVGRVFGTPFLCARLIIWPLCVKFIEVNICRRENCRAKGWKGENRSEHKSCNILHNHPKQPRDLSSPSWLIDSLLRCCCCCCLCYRLSLFPLPPFFSFSSFRSSWPVFRGIFLKVSAVRVICINAMLHILSGFMMQFWNSTLNAPFHPLRVPGKLELCTLRRPNCEWVRFNERVFRGNDALPMIPFRFCPSVCSTFAAAFHFLSRFLG